MYIIKDVDIITENEILKNFDIKFSDTIIDIKQNIKTCDEDIIIEGKNHYLSPGFIDIHIHGSFGIDIMDASKKELLTLTSSLSKAGTTSYLPTVMTSSVDRMKKAIEKIIYIKNNSNVVKGINLEGPLLNPDKAGAQNKKYMTELNFHFFDKYKDIIKIVTLAPEKKGALKLIEKLNELNIVASMGHTDATYKESVKGFNSGISLTTHIFNGMRGIHHRDIGAAGAALLHNISIEVIADLIHVSLPMIKLILKLKDIDQIVLITDAQPAALFDGEITEFNKKKVYIKNGSARYEDGTLAGSTLSMHEAVKNIYKSTDLKLTDIIKMASVNPAKKIGIDHKLGKIKEEMISDMILLSRNLEIKKVFKEGKLIKQ